jgi:hypothetical protein
MIAGTRLAEAAEVISVSDRESDIYPFFARKPENVDLIIRAAQDRALGSGRSLFQAPVAWQTLGVTEVHVAPRGPGDKGRVAKVALKAGEVIINRPKGRGLTEIPRTSSVSWRPAKSMLPGASLHS